MCSERISPDLNEELLQPITAQKTGCVGLHDSGSLLAVRFSKGESS